MNWLCWHVGTVTDPKFQVVAKRCLVAPAIVIAMWTYVLERAAHGSERGDFGKIDPEDCAMCLGIGQDVVERILVAFDAKALTSGQKIVNWSKRQNGAPAVRMAERRANSSNMTNTTNKNARVRTSSKSSLQTDRQTDRQTEEKKEEGSADAAPASGPIGDYVFAGKVIKLTQKDFQSWERAYPHVALAAELQSRDDWLASPAANDKQRRDWFHGTSGALARVEAAVVGRERVAHEPRDPWRKPRTLNEIAG